jgi:uncharacterized repeat protein (TIGR01451 family)
MTAYPFSPAQSWADGGTYTPWFDVFNGVGGAQTSNGTALNQVPATALSPGQTFSSLSTTIASFNSASNPVDITATVVNNGQLRQGSTPNVWEAPWLYFAHDTVPAGPNGIADAYYVTLATDRLSLGRVTSGNGGLAPQCFYADDLTAGTPVGTSAVIRVVHTGNLIQVYKDGILRITFTDDGVSGTCSGGTRPPAKTAGKVGIYTEDANVTWSGVDIINGSTGSPNWSTSVGTQSHTTATPGQTVTYTLTVTNSGTAPGAATINMTFPPGLQNPTWTMPGGSPATGTGSVLTTTPTVPAGTSVVMTLTGQAPASGQIAAAASLVNGTEWQAYTAITVSGAAACGPGTGTTEIPVNDWNGVPSCGPGSGGHKTWTRETGNWEHQPPFTGNYLATMYLNTSNSNLNWTTNNTGFHHSSQMLGVWIEGTGGSCGNTFNNPGFVTVNFTLNYWTTAGTWASTVITASGSPGSAPCNLSGAPLPVGSAGRMYPIAALPANADPNGIFYITGLTGTYSGPFAPQGQPGLAIQSRATIAPGADVPCGTTGEIPCAVWSTSTKTVSPNPANVGDTVTYTVTVTNSAAGSPATAPTITDSVPAGITGVVWAMTGATPASGAGNTISLTGPALSGGQSATLTISGTVSDPSGIPANTVVIDGTNVVSPPITVNGPNWSTSTKVASPNPATQGGTITYALTIRNTGAVAGTAVVTDTLPAGLSGAAWTAPGATPASGTGNPSFTTPSIAPGGSFTATITATAATVGTIPANVAVVSGTNVSSLPVSVTASPANFTTSTKTGPATTLPGSQFQYTINVRNTGGTAATATVTDTLPFGVSMVSWSAPGFSPASGSGPLNTSGTVAPGATMPITVTVLTTGATNTTILPNVAVINGANVQSNPVFIGIPDTNVTFTKTAVAANVVSGQVATTTITAVNAGPDLSTALISDPLTGLDSGGRTWTAVGSAGVTGSMGFGTGVLSETVSIPAGGQIVYSLQHTTGLNGSHQNTATYVEQWNGGKNLTASAIVTVAPQRAPEISKTTSTPLAAPGQPVTFTLCVENFDLPHTITVTDPIPAWLVGATFTSVSTGAVIGASGYGTGPVNDTLTFTGPGKVTYTITGEVAADVNVNGYQYNRAVMSVDGGTPEYGVACVYVEVPQNLCDVRAWVVPVSTSPGAVTWKVVVINYGPYTGPVDITVEVPEWASSMTWGAPNNNAAASGGFPGTAFPGGALQETVNMQVGGQTWFPITTFVDAGWPYQTTALSAKVRTR